MNKTRAVWLAAGFLALSSLGVPLDARAAPLTAPELVSLCSGDAMGKAKCDGYLMAVTDIAKQREGHGRGGKVCLPDDLTIEKARAGVIDAAKQKAGGRGDNAPALRMIAAALRANWPCDGARQSGAGSRGGGQR